MIQLLNFTDYTLFDFKIILFEPLKNDISYLNLISAPEFLNGNISTVDRIIFKTDKLKFPIINETKDGFIFKPVSNLKISYKPYSGDVYYVYYKNVPVVKSISPPDEFNVKPAHVIEVVGYDKDLTFDYRVLDPDELRFEKKTGDFLEVLIFLD